jgi:isochorismate synthase EntC
MTEIVVALIGTVGVIAVGYLEHGRRANNARWEQNSVEHGHVVDKIETIGRSLGISIDRVEETALRTEQKLDQHLNDHLTGKLRDGKKEKEQRRVR